MTRSHPILIAPLCVSLLATLFCVWTALGNDVNICVTTGCTLYQDFSIAGLSLWWFGTGAFSLLLACALLGQTAIGLFLAGLFLFGDGLLLFLMSLTSPCVNCLVVAVLFALAYAAFRAAGPPHDKVLWTHRFLKCFWGFFFIINIGMVMRSQLAAWPILDEGEAKTKVFFSLSCPRCLQSINALSGRVDIAYYPIADNDADLFRIAHMQKLLHEGENMADAVRQSRDIAGGSRWASWIDPQLLILRFRLLRNKSYIFQAGSQGVPFFEYLGIPPELLEKIKAGKQAAPQEAGKDATLPAEILDSGQCIGDQPCPPGMN